MKRILLDTSVQIGRFKYSEIEDYIRKASATSKVYCSFFVLFEFKVGLILSCINYWDLVNISSSNERAMILWSEKYGAREPKNLLILESLIKRFFKKPSNQQKKYLRQIEAVILILMTNFKSGIEKNLIGDFKEDELVRCQILSRKDYPVFSKLCEDKKEMIDQTNFWNKHGSELDMFLASPELKKDYAAVYSALLKIKTDLRYASMMNTNKKIGDCVIAVDTPKKNEVLTTDNSFQVLCTLLNKKTEVIPNKYT